MISKFKIILLTPFLILTITLSSTFEQNGVKEGNTKISIGFDDDKTKGKEANRKFYGSYGNFISNDVELFVKLKYSTEAGIDSCFLELGGSYYFLKSVTLTPYIGYGAGIECINSQWGTSDEEDAFIGIHNFLSENIAISTEFGVDIINATEYLGRYLSVNLTYFFD